MVAVVVMVFVAYWVTAFLYDEDIEYDSVMPISSGIPIVIENPMLSVIVLSSVFVVESDCPFVKPLVYEKSISSKLYPTSFQIPYAPKLPLLCTIIDYGASCPFPPVKFA